MSRQVISANRLNDGLVVYLTADDGWSERIDEARLIDGDADASSANDAAAGAVARQIVVDPYPVDIDESTEESNGEIRPSRFREFIRAKGPTVRRDLGKQAEAR